VSRSRDLGDVGSKANFLDNVSTDLGDYSGQSIPHIIPDVLYPAVEGKDLAGVEFSGSYVYGTAHTDGRKYYYTDIKGSKPIKDPRIGGHFGSQRHKVRSIQLLEQETATHGQNVYSVDGREWFRAVGPDWIRANNAYGNYIYIPYSATTGADFVEIVGYFNAINMSGYSGNSDRDITLAIDGTANSSNFTGLSASVPTPISGTRYVDGGSVVNLTFDSTPSLGIHTVKIGNVNGDYLGALYGIELIAQDTSSTANRSKIQIPSQNVVSYGKKFTVSGTPHYDPFNGFTSGSSVSSYVDTATSLGLDKWLHSSTYYRPYNGGRVVKWVDSSGVIKTSVTLMPPNAKSIADSSSLTNATAKANASASNDTFYPTFEAHTTDVNEDQLHEVAKTFHWREFGNGSANGGTGATYADASMLNSNDGIAYVMDDGLSSFSSDAIEINSSHLSAHLYGTDDFAYITFIGTGITVSGDEYFGPRTIAQNLPYGTHILKIVRDSNGKSVYSLDGVSILTSSETSYGEILEITFHQPKRPPIPEDACVLADYMLMADFVPQTDGDLPHISKGVRFCNSSRDGYYDSNANDGLTLGSTISKITGGYQVKTEQNGHTLSEGRIVGFGHAFGVNFNRDSDRMNNPQVRLDGNNYTYASSDIWDTDTVWDDTNDDGTIDKSGSASQETYGIKNQTLGVHTFGDKSTYNPGSSNNYNDWAGFQIATPIHTSHHYQSFETPFLHELVGGDRNMEQTNLVCSPDGKTWDEVTRDTSYIGNNVLSLGRTNNTAANTSSTWILDDCRGVNENKDFYNKFFAIAYDRVICLQDGSYRIIISAHYATEHVVLNLNGSEMHRVHAMDGGYGAGSMQIAKHLKKGDYLQFAGGYSGSSDNWRYTNFQIEKL